MIIFFYVNNKVIKPVLSNIKGVTEDNNKEKPQIGKLYDLTKYGTDLVDQRIWLVKF